MSNIVLAIGIFVFAAYLFRAVFRRTGIPDVLLLMVCGLLLGPGLGWVTPADFGQAGRVIATLALVVILFESGVDLDIASLRPSLSATLKITLSTFAATAAIVAGVGLAIAGLSLQAALMLGAILAGTSAAVVIPLVQSLGVQGKARTVLILESALTDVLCIVALMLLLDVARRGQLDAGTIVAGFVETLLVAAVIGWVVGLCWLMVLRHTRRLRNGSFSSLAMCFIVYGLTEDAGFSGAIAAIAFGVALANGRRFAAATRWMRPGRLAAFSQREHEFLREVIFVLKTFFFVYLGVSMRTDDASIIAVGAAIVLPVYAVRHFVAAALCDRDIGARDTTLIAAMVPKGLAAAVLASLPAQAGITGGERVQAIAYAVVLLSIILTALLIALQRIPAVARGYARLMGRPA